MLNELIRQCRSVRRFDITNPVEPSVLSQILECVSALPSAANLQRIRYAAVAGDRALSLFSGISLGGYLPVDKKPTPDVAPTAYIVLFAEQRESDPNLFIDIGIAAEAISLSARELGVATCIVRNFKKEVFASLSNGKDLVPQLVLAMGYPQERVELIPVDEDASLKYFKGDDGINYVPKRSLDELILK